MGASCSCSSSQAVDIQEDPVSFDEHIKSQPGWKAQLKQYLVAEESLLTRGIPRPAHPRILQIQVVETQKFVEGLSGAEKGDTSGDSDSKGVSVSNVKESIRRISHESEEHAGDNIDIGSAGSTARSDTDSAVPGDPSVGPSHHTIETLRSKSGLSNPPSPLSSERLSALDREQEQDTGEEDEDEDEGKAGDDENDQVHSHRSDSDSPGRRQRQRSQGNSSDQGSDSDSSLHVQDRRAPKYTEDDDSARKSNFSTETETKRSRISPQAGWYDDD